MDIPALCREIRIDAVENYLAHGRYHGDRTYGRPIAAEFEAFPSLILRFWKENRFAACWHKRHNSCHAVPEERKLWKAWTILALQKSPSRRRCFVSSSFLSFSLMDFLDSPCQNTSEVWLIVLWWCGEKIPSSILCKSRFKISGRISVLIIGLSPLFIPAMCARVLINRKGTLKWKGIWTWPWSLM